MAFVVFMEDHRSLFVFRVAKFEFVLIAPYSEYTKAMMSGKKTKYRK